MMKEPDQRFSLASIDQQTEQFFSELSTQDNRLIAELYSTYAPSREEQSRSLQHIWNRIAQTQGQQYQVENSHLSERITIVNANRSDAPVPGTFQRPQQAASQRQHRALWRKVNGGAAIAFVLVLILIWVLLSQVFLMKNSPTTLGSTSLTLGGSPQFNNTVIFLVKSSEGGQDLATISFETYDGHTWSNPPLSRSQLPTNRQLGSESKSVHLVTQQITPVNTFGEQQPYLFGSGQIASIDQPTIVLINPMTRSQIAVLLNNGTSLTVGKRYTVRSFASSATVTDLKSIPLPADAPVFPANYRGPFPITYYNPAILRAYLQVPKNLDPRILITAKQITTKAKSMYDKVVALENYLQENYLYNVNVSVPSGQEAVSWLLFHGANQGFCNYFATAMAVMARELGIPARIVTGYISGSYDAKTQNWSVHDFDAHAWTQVYFAGYGWIDFEPSPGFSPFPRPL